jgi:hypothetical protein
MDGKSNGINVKVPSALSATTSLSTPTINATTSLTTPTINATTSLTSPIINATTSLKIGATTINEKQLKDLLNGNIDTITCNKIVMGRVFMYENKDQLHPTWTMKTVADGESSAWKLEFQPHAIDNHAYI